MLMEEESSFLSLIFINLGAETDISLRLLHSELELLHPDGTVPIHEFIQFLETREHGARGRADDEQRLITFNRLPTSSAVSCVIEVVAALYIHGLTRSETHALADCCHSLRTEYLTHTSVLDNCVVRRSMELRFTAS